MRSYDLSYYHRKIFLLELVVLIMLLGLMLSACSLPTSSTSEEDAQTSSTQITLTIQPTLSRLSPSETPSPTANPVHTTAPTMTTKSETQLKPTTTPTVRQAPDPQAWREIPVIPTVSDTARKIYHTGLELGRNPHAFSKIGDCQSITTYFLALFDKPGWYELGEYSPLQETIDWFAGSFERESLAVKGGLNAAAVLSPLRANPEMCEAGESPVTCELRVNNASIVIISLEEWWADDPTKYERYMRQIIDITISQGVLPILATKADNLEGNHLINQTLAILAWEYDIPLWNFWLAVQELPNHGLIENTADGQSDMFHLTRSLNYYDFSDPQALKSGWGMRNLTALRALDSVWHGLNTDSQP